jgi:hypothetical protein
MIRVISYLSRLNHVKNKIPSKMAYQQGPVSVCSGLAGIFWGCSINGGMAKKHDENWDIVPLAMIESEVENPYPSTEY